MIFASKRNVRRKQCTLKRRYDNQQEADHAVDRMHMNGYAFDGRHGWSAIHAYKCSYCGGWHVGHKRIDPRVKSLRATARRDPFFLLGVADA